MAELSEEWTSEVVHCIALVDLQSLLLMYDGRIAGFNTLFVCNSDALTLCRGFHSGFSYISLQPIVLLSR